MNETTFTEFVIYGVFPVALLVGMLMSLERNAERLSLRGKKLKFMEVVCGLGGAFIVLAFWSQLAGKALP